MWGLCVCAFWQGDRQASRKESQLVILTSHPYLISSYSFLYPLGLFSLFTSAAFDYQTDKRLAGAVIACTALYVMNFAYSVRQQEPRALLLRFGSRTQCGQNATSDVILISVYDNYPGFYLSILIHSFLSSSPFSQWGPLAWVVSAEIFPQRLRGKGMTITTLANWLTNFCIAKAVPVMILPER